MDGLTDPQGSGPDHSRLLTSPFNWDPASNFTSTLDMDAIAVSHTTDCSLSSEARSLSWDTEPGPGPPLLVPHHLDSPPRLKPAMVQESSSESESESEESDSGSSSSSCSSIETDASSDEETEV